MRLEGKVAIVTGANGAFGSAIVPGFAKEGCEIACVDWTEDDANAAAQKVHAFGHRALGLGVDLRDSAQVLEDVQGLVDGPQGDGRDPAAHPLEDPLGIGVGVVLE